MARNSGVQHEKMNRQKQNSTDWWLDEWISEFERNLAEFQNWTHEVVFEIETFKLSIDQKLFID